MPKTYLIQDLICRDLLSDRALRDPNFTLTPITVGGGTNSQCDEDDEVQRKTAIFIMWTNLIAGILSACVAPYLGALSDRVGRKPVVVGCTVGAFVGELITIMVGRFPDSVSVNWILVGNMADGLCGSFTTSLALCFAYAADCTAPERRNVAFGQFHACLFAGVAIGPIVAGAMIKGTGDILSPFYFALACHLFFTLFTAIFVPESLSKERQLVARERYESEKASRPRWSMKDLNILAPLSILRPRGPGSSSKLRRNLLVLATIDTMMFGVAMGSMQIVVIYARKRFHWDPVASSGFVSAQSVIRVLSLVVALPLLTRLIRGPAGSQPAGHRGSDKLDIGLIRGSIVFDLFGYFGFAFTPSGLLMVVSGMVAALGGVGPPTLQSSMTKHIPADRTGQVLGASGLLHALARVVAPIIFNLIYSSTVATFAGFVFVCLGSVFAIVFVLSWFIRPGVFLDGAAESGADAEESEAPTQLR